jgi:Family of unknown function (DUF6350)
MTELVTRGTAASRYSENKASSVWWRGALSALWVVAFGCAALVVVVLIAWAADSRSGSSAASAIRTALQIWLSAHRVPLRMSQGTIGVAPLGLTLLLGFLVARAAAVLARGHEIGDPRGVGTAALAVGVPYGVLVTFVADAATSSGVHPDPLGALLGGLVVGVVFAGWGAARGGGCVQSCWAMLPPWARTSAAAGAAAMAVFAMSAVALVAVSVVTHAATVVRLAHGLGGGAVGIVAVVALDVALVPNAALCGLAYLAGPGFAVGSGTSVSIASVHVGALPALPLLATVPSHPAGFAVDIFVVVALVGAGVVAAAVVARTGQPLTRSMALAAGAGVAAGMLAGLLAAAAGGPAGPGRMTAFGPSPWQVALAVAVEVSVVACGAAGALTWRRGR